ncbi:MAG TPA: solute carrier family 23 protein [Xanthobacteraceae bacterium]|nr:solute carrier family 23 protein [Xanthobacteraceae bacterium]
MKKPATLIYGLEEMPPPFITISNGIQHVGLIAINLVFPLLVFRAAGTPLDLIGGLLSSGLVVLGIGTFLQAYRLGPIGSGYMCPSTFTATYLAPSLLAAKIGGLPLVFGMTLFSGVLEAAIAPLLNRLRAIFPPEISGLVILLIGMSIGTSGLRLVLAPGAEPLSGAEWLVAGATLVTMVGLNVWGVGTLRMLCALIGLVIGYIAAGFAGLFGTTFVAVHDADWIGFPIPAHLAWAFDATMIAPFAIASVAAALKAAGTIALCQRMNDADWVRPEMGSTTRGVLADGAATAVAGLMGAVGTNTSTPGVGLAAAIGVGSRPVAYAVAVLFVLLAFFPKLTALLAIMPRAVMVSALLFTATFIIINGIQVISSRLLDARRSMIIGFSMVAGISVDIFPSLSAAAPKMFMPVVGSPLVFGTVIALGLNLLFRIGVRRTVNLTLDQPEGAHQRIDDFFVRQGAAWGARPDVIKRAIFGVTQLVDAVDENCRKEGPMTVTASFDEFNLDIRLAYQGALLEFPEQRPSADDIRAGLEGMRRLAGFMLRRNADRIASERAGDRVVVHFHFDH